MKLTLTFQTNASMYVKTLIYTYFIPSTNKKKEIKDQ